MPDIAALITATSSLLWPVFAFAALFIFRDQIRVLLLRLGTLNKGRFLGMEFEFRDVLKQDSSSDVLHAYMWPDGAYDDRRRKILNSLLRELGIIRDVRLILAGEEGAPLRNLLIDYAKRKGLAVTSAPHVE